MNTHQKIHQSKLVLWAQRIQEQTSSGLTITQNGISENAYYYWEHLLKDEYMDVQSHDIVSMPLQSPEHLPKEQGSSPLCNSDKSSDLQNLSNSQMLYNSCNSADIRISTKGIDISISPSAPDDLILRIIKTVRYA